MTLTELLVSMIVFSIAVGMVFSAVILTMGWSRETQQAADAVNELRMGLAQIDRQVRSGNVLFSPEDEDTWISSCQDGGPGSNAGTCMRIFTQANGDEKCVQWQVADDASGTGQVLQSRSWSIDWQTSGAVSPWAVVARDLRWDASTPMPFTLEGASTPYKDRMLRVHIEVMDERQGETVEIDSSLTGRNTTYGFDSGQCTPVPPA
jgi:type II secretory pathway pseudopilin PulG